MLISINRGGVDEHCHCRNSGPYHALLGDMCLDESFLFIDFAWMVTSGSGLCLAAPHWKVTSGPGLVILRTGQVVATLDKGANDGYVMLFGFRSPCSSIFGCRLVGFHIISHETLRGVLLVSLLHILVDCKSSSARECSHFLSSITLLSSHASPDKAKDDNGWGVASCSMRHGVRCVP